MLFTIWATGASFCALCGLSVCLSMFAAGDFAGIKVWTGLRSVVVVIVVSLLWPALPAYLVAQGLWNLWKSMKIKDSK